MSGRGGLRLIAILAVVVATGLWIAIRGGEAQRALGPVDGHELPPTDLERVSPGDLAPDFALRALSGDTITLSSFRGDHDVVLVFYRGHW